MRWTLGWIQDAGWVTQINVLASYVTGVLIKEITPLLENYNRKKIKAEDLRGKQFFG